MTVIEVCAEVGIDLHTHWRMKKMGLIGRGHYLRAQYDPSEVRAALPEYRWRRRHGGDHSPLFKVCSVCETEKSISEFRRVKAKTTKYGYSILRKCRSCECATKKKADPERSKQYQREWRSRPEVAERIRASRKRRESLPKRQLERRISKRMRENLRSGFEGGIWRDALPYTVSDLKIHLERQFLPGMSWDNMADWHIDHIIPQSSFSYETTDNPEFQQCWALTNLRPMWASENISKGARRETLL